MVKAAKFVRGISEVLDVPENVVAGEFRELRKAGLVSTGARGVNAPEMTFLDAARMLIALAVTESPVRAIDAARDFGTLPKSSRSDHSPVPGILRRFDQQEMGLSRRHSFEEAVAALLKVFTEEWWLDFAKKTPAEVGGNNELTFPYITINIEALSAEIEMAGNQIKYNTFESDLSISDLSGGISINDLLRSSDIIQNRYRRAIRTQRKIGTTVLRNLGALIAKREPSE